MSIYTKTGDEGKTSLFGGKRVSKADLRITAYGQVDELNANIGLLLAKNETTALSIGTIADVLEPVQHELFVIGSHLATPHDPNNTPDALPSLDHASTGRLEEQIDTLDAELPELKNFILPGGAPSAAQAHIARTVCRRAERAVVLLAEREEIHPDIQQYLNRLSDFLFVLARAFNHAAGVKETNWKA